LALGLLGRAAREDPNNEQRWLQLADAASGAGAHMQAIEALEKVARRHGGADPALKQRIDAEHAAALGGYVSQPR
jgi:predicted Zn-dependent protease